MTICSELIYTSSYLMSYYVIHSTFFHAHQCHDLKVESILHALQPSEMKNLVLPLSQKA